MSESTLRHLMDSIDSLRAKSRQLEADFEAQGGYNHVLWCLSFITASLITLPHTLVHAVTTLDRVGILVIPALGILGIKGLYSRLRNRYELYRTQREITEYTDLLCKVTGL